MYTIDSKFSRIMTILLVTIFLLTISACRKKYAPDRSPCVSIDQGPCSDRKPVNNWLENVMLYNQA